MQKSCAIILRKIIDNLFQYFKLTSIIDVLIVTNKNNISSDKHFDFLEHMHYARALKQPLHCVLFEANQCTQSN
jgi:hypothetical protein